MLSSQNQNNAILVLNSGSSSLKFGLYRQEGEDEGTLLEGSAEGVGRESGSIHIRSSDGTSLLSEEHILESQTEALQKLASALNAYLHVAPVAVGHRIVHGGPHLREHQRLTPEVLAQLQDAVHFAPLHIPQALTLVKQAQKIFPKSLHFACFDTAFHRTMPEVASHLPLPIRYFEQGVIRYGFHGLSCESVVDRLRNALPQRMIICHLGNGSSVTAVRNGKSIDTSMGLTPTGGVPMGTRSGDLDPGVMLYMMRVEHLNSDALEEIVNRESGLAGFSDGESDMQCLLEQGTVGNLKAQLAIDAYAIAVRKYIGAFAALMSGVDLVVFTGGIGEHASEIRERICDGLLFLGIDLSLGERGKVLILKAQEESQMSRICRQLLAVEPNS